MSFLSGLGNLAKSTFGFLTGNSIGSQVARTVLTGFAVKKMADSRQVDTNQNDPSIQEETPDYGIRAQVNADTTTRIPVVYGRAYTSGKVFDVRMDNNNQTMWYAMALSENTGALLSTGASSVFTFRTIFYNNARLVFQSDGITVDHTVDVNGLIDFSLQGLVKVYLYQGDTSSGSQKSSLGSTVTTPVNGYAVFPQWTSQHTADGLVFALVRVDYDKEKNAAGLGSFVAELENSMTLPGDVLNDYMKSTDYGAKIPISRINQDTTGNGLKALNTFSDVATAYVENRPITLKLGGGFATQTETKSSGTIALTVNCDGAILDLFGTGSSVAANGYVKYTFTGVDDPSVIFNVPTPSNSLGWSKTPSSPNYTLTVAQNRYPGGGGTADAINNLNAALTTTTFGLTNQTSNFSYTIEIGVNDGLAPGSIVFKQTQTVNVTVS